jgi:hypothetical protein
VRRLVRRTPATAGAALALAASAAAPAAAATICAGTGGAGCDVVVPTAQQAFAEAVAGDRIELGELVESAPLDDGGRQLAVIGAGEGVTVLAGGLKLSDPGSAVMAATLGGLDLAGTATWVLVEGTAGLHAGALLRSAAVSGHVHALDGAARLETVALDLASGPGLRVACAAELEARHVTVAGTPDAAVTTDCASSEARVSDSILWAPFEGPGTVTTSHSDYPPVAGRPDGPGDRHVEPGFAPGGLRLAPGSPLLDAGTPETLADSEWPQDRDGLPRAADGDGDGIALRDPGAFELPPAAVPVPAGNLLRDPGGEDGGAWATTDGFARERYGAFPFPSAATGAALGAGAAFLAGGTALASSAGQLVDLTGFAPEIDRGGATASLAGLLGGYRADADAGSMEAMFLDPAGRPLGAPVALTAPSAAERANATTLLPRSRTGAIPPLARSVEVTLRAARATGGYSDAYFDNLALTVAAPGAPPPPADPGPDAPPVKPFAGIRVLTGAAPVDRKGRVAVRLACVDGTVGGCSGVLTLAGALRRRSEPAPLAVASVALQPGATRRVHLRLSRAARRAVRQRRRIRMTLFAAVRDGQRLTRVSTDPLTVRWRKPPERDRRR